MADDPDSTKFTPGPTAVVGNAAKESKPAVVEPAPAQEGAEVRPEESPPPGKQDALAPSTSDAVERDTEKTPAINASTSGAETASTADADPNTQTIPTTAIRPIKVHVGWVDPDIADAIQRMLSPKPASGSPGALIHEPEDSPSPDMQPSKTAPASAAWSRNQILAWIISKDETKVLTFEMLAKIERAGKELAKAMVKELKKMLARSVDRAVLEGQTLHGLDEGVFRIGGIRSGMLAHFLRIGQLTPEDIQWDVIDGDPEGVKQLWPARETDMPPPVELEPSPPSSQVESELSPPSPQVASEPPPEKIAEAPIQPKRRGAKEKYDWDVAMEYLRGILEVRGDPLNQLNAYDGWRSEADAGRLIQDFILEQLKQPLKQKLKQELEQELKQEPKQELKQKLKQELEQKLKQRLEQELKEEPKKEPDFSTVMRHVRPELKKWREREKHNRA